MPSSEILQCVDCLEHFCTTCDFESKRCPDCGEPMCQECAEFALDTRRGRCFTCDDPELADNSFPQWVRDGGMKKRWQRPNG
jgi:hypothetical protein